MFFRYDASKKERLSEYKLSADVSTRWKLKSAVQVPTLLSRGHQDGDGLFQQQTSAELLSKLKLALFLKARAG